MFFNWIIFEERGASQNAGPGSGERTESALRRPCVSGALNYIFIDLFPVCKLELKVLVDI